MPLRSPISKPARAALLFALTLSLALASLPAAAADQHDLQGTWTKKSFAVAGSWTIDAEARTITLSAEFKTRNAPDLKLFLSPRSADEVSNRTATDKSILVAPLRSNKGAQTYQLPDSVDLSQYRSVLIHCERYTKLWAAADLKAP